MLFLCDILDLTKNKVNDMIILKIFNNNVVLSEEMDQEVIVMGRGLAFGKKVGEELDDTAIEKRYIL